MELWYCEQLPELLKLDRVLLKYAKCFWAEEATYHIVIALETATDVRIIRKCFDIQAWDPKDVLLQVILSAEGSCRYPSECAVR